MLWEDVILPFLLLHEVQEDLYQSLHMENLMELLEMKHITYWSLPNTAAPGSSTLSSWCPVYINKPKLSLKCFYQLVTPVLLLQVFRSLLQVSRFARLSRHQSSDCPAISALLYVQEKLLTFIQQILSLFLLLFFPLFLNPCLLLDCMNIRMFV